ncbi:hypothetical protein B0T24DRAFT_335268 [Lasiosphaeria ovina]|uniref:Uncharacterized protein n=1 Tax=Lasiosphaeria ovina TaxID=92902 RepID=A0AAE0K979_9PEZI|nr:hypothetical protein B0T24DRAFT_335268 [Lasiosphaeria ovina]
MWQLQKYHFWFLFLVRGRSLRSSPHYSSPSSFPSAAGLGPPDVRHALLPARTRGGKAAEKKVHACMQCAHASVRHVETFSLFCSNEPVIRLFSGVPHTYTHIHISTHPLPGVHVICTCTYRPGIYIYIYTYLGIRDKEDSTYSNPGRAASLCFCFCFSLIEDPADCFPPQYHSVHPGSACHCIC